MHRVLTAVALLLAGTCPLRGSGQDVSQSPEQRREAEARAQALNKSGLQEYGQNNLVKAKEAVREAVVLYRRLYPLKDFPDGHPDLATSLSNLATVLNSAGESAAAEPLGREALTMRRRLYPDGHPELARSLANVALLRLNAGDLAEAEPLYREALVLNRRLYPPKDYPRGHFDLVRNLSDLALVYRRAGEYAKAEPLYREALDLGRRLFPKEEYPDGHTSLATLLFSLAALDKDMERYAEAEPLYLEALALRRRLFPAKDHPDGRPELAYCLRDLADLYLLLKRPAEAGPYCREALVMRRRLYSAARYPNGHREVAESLHDLGNWHFAQGEFDLAEAAYREALAARRRLASPAAFPAGHAELARSLTSLAAVYHRREAFARAERLFREALALRRRLAPPATFPKGAKELAESLHNLAVNSDDAGDRNQAERFYREALALRRRLYPKELFPKGHPDLVQSLRVLGRLYDNARQFARSAPLYEEIVTLSRLAGAIPRDDLAADLKEWGGALYRAGERSKAEPIYREALALHRLRYPAKDFPDGHPDLAQSLNNLATLYGDGGEYTKAVALFAEALALRRRLYPKAHFPAGHKDLAQSLRNLAVAHEDAEEYAQAEPLHEEALAMLRLLFPPAGFPEGQAQLAEELVSLASLYRATERYAKAEPLHREALALRRRLYPKEEYPDGHFDIAQSVNNYASLLNDAGDPNRAEPLYREAVALFRGLYPPTAFPDGHPNVATGLNNLAFFYLRCGRDADAVGPFREALALYPRLLHQFARAAAEAEAVNYAATLPLTLDGFLSATRRTREADAYDALWQARGALARLQAGRHRDLFAHRDPEVRALADDLRDTRRTLEALLSQNKGDPQSRSAALERLGDRKEDLEKRIAARLGVAALPAAADVPSRRLADALPPDAAYVDVYQYTVFEQDPKIPGKKGEYRHKGYVAFVVRRGRPVARVELKGEVPIEIAWAAWHKLLTAKAADDRAERAAAAEAGRLLWEPLREHLPPEVKTVYLTPDGLLHQLPWGALPGRKPETVVLDDCAVCLVESGSFLLERLEEKPKPRPGPNLLVAYGGVAYDDAPAGVRAPRGGALAEASTGDIAARFSPLPASAIEVDQIGALAKKSLGVAPVVRRGAQASTAHLEEDLPRARFLHLATHGFFANPEVRKKLKVDPSLFAFAGRERRSVGARNPLVLSGLAFAGANRRGADAPPDHGLITAEGLLGLHMEGLELAVLSACETGLGDDGGHEGVYGLQRVFHIAGCKNVIASLWQVDDKATQVLVNLFYRNLWEKKLPAAEALRQAQLSLYRDPIRAGEEARRDLDFTPRPLPTEAPKATPKRAPAAHWAAFTFSGVRS